MRSAARKTLVGRWMVLIGALLGAPSGWGQTAAPITLTVDASEAPRRILHAKLVLPAQPGPLTLEYPKWIPGEHAPTGPVANLVGLKLSAGGQPLTWQRDPVDMCAFRCEVPAGANAVEATYDFLSPGGTEGFSSTAASTAQLAILSWNQLVLYPQGKPAADLIYSVRLRLPTGWKFGTALPVANATEGLVEFKPVSLVTLVDSPLITGAFFRSIDLTPGETPPHVIAMVSDSAAALEMPADLIECYKQLVAEAGALFGARHYERYCWLLTLSDHVAHFGLEHHESSDNRAEERAAVKDDLQASLAGLLAHEYVHSWNGKYRRPAGLATPDFHQPMKDELLWVYEGLTQYLGTILPPRSGLWTPKEFTEYLAWVAAYLDHRAGRAWRPLVDTAVAAQLLYEAPSEWAAWRRGVDFYDEGILLWLEADVLIRQQTGGKSSVDDFCKRFHGGQGGQAMVKPYTFEDVVNTLNEIAPYDWKTFFTTRLNSTDVRAPLGGITGGGWKLVYDETPNDYMESREHTEKTLDFTFSIGLDLKDDGSIADVIPGMAAAKAGIAPGMILIAVNGRKWSPERLCDAIRATKTSQGPLELLIENVEFYKTYALDYHDGLKYPHLVRDPAKPDLLEQIIKSLTAPPEE